MKGIKTALVIMLLTSGMSGARAELAEAFNSSENISFTGKITESTCRVSQQASEMISLCDLNGISTLRTMTYAEETLQSHIAQQQIRWLNPQRSRAIVTVSYN
ncbi:hypothetical protein [Erwinia sp. 9145]|uniref:hypothetical protein n=1 Tax=Erwinia sp. 9145 TaxID=1500895 RepID=UPI000552CB1B|nr:hypothetical protein [Erwinia sp. 9145]